MFASARFDADAVCRRQSQARLDRRQPGSHAAVIDVAADPDTHSPDQSRVLLERGFEARAVNARQVRLDVAAEVVRQSRSGFNDRFVPIAFQSDHPPKIREHGQPTTAFGSGDLSRNQSDAVGIQPLIDQTQSEQLSRGPPGSSGRFHGSSQLPGGLLGQAAVILGRQDFARHRCGRLDNEPANFAPEFGQHARVVPFSCLAGSDENLFGRSHRFPGFFRLDARGRGTGFLYQLLSLRTGFRQHIPAVDFDSGELRLDLLRIGQAAGDLLAAGLQDPEDRFVRERIQHDANDPEADHLGHQMRPVDPERAGDLFESSAALRHDLQR
jgi:hypothetical protein